MLFTWSKTSPVISVQRNCKFKLHAYSSLQLGIYTSLWIFLRHDRLAGREVFEACRTNKSRGRYTIRGEYFLSIQNSSPLLKLRSNRPRSQAYLTHTRDKLIEKEVQFFHCFELFSEIEAISGAREFLYNARRENFHLDLVCETTLTQRYISWVQIILSYPGYKNSSHRSTCRGVIFLHDLTRI